jgi:hypothetical protein
MVVSNSTIHIYEYNTQYIHLFVHPFLFLSNGILQKENIKNKKNILFGEAISENY